MRNKLESLSLVRMILDLENRFNGLQMYVSINTYKDNCNYIQVFEEAIESRSRHGDDYDDYELLVSDEKTVEALLNQRFNLLVKLVKCVKIESGFIIFNTHPVIVRY